MSVFFTGEKSIIVRSLTEPWCGDDDRHGWYEVDMLFQRVTEKCVGCGAYRFTEYREEEDEDGKKAIKETWYEFHTSGQMWTKKSCFVYREKGLEVGPDTRLISFW